MPNHRLKTFEGEDWSTGKVRKGLNNGKASLAWNIDNGERNEIILVVKDCFDSKMEGAVVLNKETATDLLNHLTELLKETDDEA